MMNSSSQLVLDFNTQLQIKGNHMIQQIFVMWNEQFLEKSHKSLSMAFGSLNWEKAVKRNPYHVSVGLMANRNIA